MAKIKNPQEFFEVFKPNGKQEEPQPPSVSKAEPGRASPDAPKSAGLSEGAPAAPSGPRAPARVSVTPSWPPMRNAEVAVVPGRVTLSLSHTGLVLVMACIAMLMIVSFWLGGQYSKKATHIPRAPETESAPLGVKQKQEPSLDNLRAMDMTPSAAKRAEEVPAKAPPVAAPVAPKKVWCLQLISAIPKDKAEEIAKSLSVNYATEVVRSGDTYGVRIGYWDSPDEVSAQRAQAHFRKEKQFRDCIFVKVEAR